MRNPESFLIRKEAREGFSHPRLREAYHRAETILAESAIDMDAFIDPYGAENVQRDKDYIQKVERSPQFIPPSEDALLLEAVMADQIELSDWMGPETFTQKTSRFDDIVNGTDLIAELKEHRAHLGLAINVTFGASQIGRKLSKIRGHLLDNRMGTIKYFLSENSDFQGRLMRIPQIVVGVEEKIVRELGVAWITKQHKILAEHPIQKLIITEIVSQLDAQIAFAQANHLEQSTLATLTRTREIMGSILKEKNNVPLETLADDRVYNEIENQTLAIFR